MSVQLDENPELAFLHAPAEATSRIAANNSRSMFDLWSMRHLIGVMVKRDLVGRYKGSVMGFFWTIINPLGHLLLYTFVFSVILKVKFGVEGGTGNFAMYLMAGMLPWGGLAESLQRATTAITEQPNLVKRVVFPLEVLPLAVSVSSLISVVVGIVLLLIVSTVMTHTFHWTVVFLPLIMLSQFIFVTGVSWLLSSLGVYLHDLRHMISLTLSIWMYATPIVYPATAFPPKIQFLVWANPMAGIVTDFRRVMLEGKPPDWPMFALYTTVALVTWCVGYYFFCKTKRSFADVV